MRRRKNKPARPAARVNGTAVIQPVEDLPRMTVFTATHHTQFLDECFQTLEAQTFDDWEWVVLLNGGARWRPEREDPRLRIVVDDSVSGVGAAKQRACLEARGSLLVELDHDDLLADDALAEIAQAFESDPTVSLVYSHAAQILEDGSKDNSQYDTSNGWIYHDGAVNGRDVHYVDSLAPTPHNVSYIWFAPNHVRAYTRTAYEQAGGYDPERHVLDDQDLMCRLYQIGDFHLVEKCLYLQRMHGRNTQRELETNDFIQQETVALYDRYFEANALAWAKRNQLLALDLGAAHGRPDGYLGVDRIDGDKVDVIHDLPEPLPFPDSSVGVIRAVDFLEHVADKVALFNELYRLLAPGGLLLSLTPSSDGRGAFQDPTHVSFYNENSFWYFTEKAYRDYVPEIEAAFQVSRLVTYFPSAWHQEHQISYVAANLIALKDPMPRNGGRLAF